jgi:hypothetical protein
MALKRRLKQEGFVAVNDVQLKLALPVRAEDKILTIILCKEIDREEMARLVDPPGCGTSWVCQRIRDELARKTVRVGLLDCREQAGVDWAMMFFRFFASSLRLDASLCTAWGILLYDSSSRPRREALISCRGRICFIRLFFLFRLAKSGAQKRLLSSLVSRGHVRATGLLKVYFTALGVTLISYTHVLSVCHTCVPGF